jgi:ATP-binding cassette subfamily F protein 3
MSGTAKRKLEPKAAAAAQPKKEEKKETAPVKQQPPTDDKTKQIKKLNSDLQKQNQLKQVQQQWETLAEQILELEA